MISLIPIFLDPLSSACSSKNETTIEDLNMKIRGSLEKAYEEQHPKHFIPSEEDSVSSTYDSLFLSDFYIMNNSFIPANFRADSKCHKHMFRKIQCIIFRNRFGRSKIPSSTT